MFLTTWFAPGEKFAPRGELGPGEKFVAYIGECSPLRSPLIFRRMEE
jgi:hypothetical protein